MLKLIEKSYESCGEDAMDSGPALAASVLALIGMGISIITIFVGFISFEISWIGVRAFMTGLLLMASPIVVYLRRDKEE